MTAVEAALAEILAALVMMAPAHEGLRDYARLDLEAEAMQVVLDALAQYDRRYAQLVAAQQALQALLTDGYPVLTIPPVSETALHNLQVNAATVEAALGSFTSNAAATMGLEGSAPVDKN